MDAMGILPEFKGVAVHDGWKHTYFIFVTATQPEFKGVAVHRPDGNPTTTMNVIIRFAMLIYRENLLELKRTINSSRPKEMNELLTDMKNILMSAKANSRVGF